jgi:hypothetical protein
MSAMTGLEKMPLELSIAKRSWLRAQARYVDGSMWLQPEGPYRTLQDLWDDEVGAEVTKEE